MQKGLSPRVRGNRKPISPHLESYRSIPACAGEPGSRRSTPTLLKVYPRVCGGTDLGISGKRTAKGLSPRVRGNQKIAIRGAGAFGSIPACAGEPFRIPPPTDRGGVYPRVCGGTLTRCLAWGRTSGLSPRVRGNPSEWQKLKTRLGSIPACAGEPLGIRILNVLAKVYPRVCGGTVPYPPLDVWGGGLSPRVRGNHAGQPLPVGIGRSIPACAGEPTETQAHLVAIRVYPRVCGGTGTPVLQPQLQLGLSPRVRGNLRSAPVRAVPRRSIPACAGEPV